VGIRTNNKAATLTLNGGMSDLGHSVLIVNSCAGGEGSSDEYLEVVCAKAWVWFINGDEFCCL
jgi:hypothetical protein